MTARNPYPLRHLPGALLAATLASAAGGSGCVRPSELVYDEWQREIPPRPESCSTVPAGENLTARLAAATSGDVFCLSPGEYPGPVAIGAGVTVWGPSSAVIRSPGKGTTVRLDGKSTRLLGVTVDGSGGRFDLLDAAVHVSGEGAEVRGVTVLRATFGILVEKASHATITGNDVQGSGAAAMGMRGDAIRLWETRGSTISGNRVIGGRDLVVWYATGNRIANNHVTDSRYGTHLMYSHDNRITGNTYRDNVVGIFVMYSRRVHIEDNLIAGSSGAAGIGVGIKEAGDIFVTGNDFVRDTTGIYLDASPSDLRDHNRFEKNSFRLGEAGVVFHGSAQNNHFFRNTFADNLDPVRVEGNGTIDGVRWEENAFDDYAGYDFDQDGFGDVPYELRSASAELASGAPMIALLRGTPALFLIEAMSRALPVFAPRLILTDPRPRLGAARRTELTRDDRRTADEG